MVLPLAPGRALGRFEVGPLAYGCWRLTNTDPAHTADLIEAALEVGMKLVDTADVYGLDYGGTGFGSAEQLLGEALRFRPGLRDQIVLATKGGIIPGVPYDSSPEYLLSAAEASLRRLKVEVIDLYQIHRPDLFIHPASLAETLTALRDRGWVTEVGVSNFTVAQVEALVAHLPFPLASHQPQFSALHLEPLRDGTFDQCMRLGITPLAWSPLGGGRLATGKGVPPALLETLDAIAAREQSSRAAVALAFVLAHPSRPVAIIGTQNPHRVREAEAALRVELTRHDVYAILQASEGRPLP